MSDPHNGVARSIREKVKQSALKLPAPLQSRFVDALTGAGELDDKLLEELLAAGLNPSDIYQLILYCRDEACLQLAPWNKGDAAEEQWASLHRLLNHFDHLYVALLNTLDERYRQELAQTRRELESEGQAFLLAEARGHWSRENEITLYNHYKELPVMAQVKIHAVRENEIVTGCISALFPVMKASSEGCCGVRTRIPGRELSLQLTVEEGSRTHIHWRYGKLIEIAKEQRSEIRVQCDKPMNTILTHDGDELLGEVRDLSTQGLGMVLQGDVDLKPGARVAYSVMMHSWELEGYGEVRWCRPSDDGTPIGLKVEYERTSNMRLQAEVIQRQRAIMAELQLHGMPDCLL